MATAFMLSGSTKPGSVKLIPHRPQQKSRSRISGIGFVFEGRFKLA
jgi:hypothetical protein